MVSPIKRERFISLLREECKRLSLSLVVDTRLGKGSHYRAEVWDGERLIAKATLKAGELSPVYEKLVRKQLGLIRRSEARELRLPPQP